MPHTPSTFHPARPGRLIRHAAHRVTASLLAAGGLLLPLSAGAATEGLAICSKCISPSVVSKTGIGTDKAVIEARYTREAVRDWCDNWQPGDKSCIAGQMGALDMKKVYRAQANCMAGRLMPSDALMPVNGQSLTLAGVWGGGDVGEGRSRWRDASGKIVGRDNASGGLGLAQQWELLCPGARGAPAAAASGKPAVASPGNRPPGAPAMAHAAPPAGRFQPGQSVMARYMGDWVPARVQAVRSVNSPKGPRLEYDVRLANGKRGLVPEGMLREP